MMRISAPYATHIPHRNAMSSPITSTDAQDFDPTGETVPAAALYTMRRV